MAPDDKQPPENEDTPEPGEHEGEEGQALTDGDPVASHSAIRSTPIPPPGVGTPQVNVGLAMQLQRSSLENLPPEVQSSLIEAAVEMDKRGYDYACKNLETSAAVEQKRIADGGVGRKQILIAFGSLAALGVVALAVTAGVLIYKDESQMAHTIVMSALGVAGAFLGGAGLPALFRHFTRSD